MLDLVGSGWSSLARAPLPDIAPPPLDQLLHLLLLHPLPPDVLHLRHPLLLLCINVAGLCLAKKRGDKEKRWRWLSSRAAVH
jgi:hypothetical protein